MQALSDFIEGLASEDILHIREPLDLDYVPTALVLDLEKRKRFPVLYLHAPRNSSMPVITNLFADRRRIAAMAGVEPDEFNRAWLEAEENRIAPDMVGEGPVQDVVCVGEPADANLLPISRHFAQDAGPYISSGIAVAKDPDTGVRNLSFHRMQLKGPNRFGMSLHSRGHLWDFFKRAETRGHNLEVAVFIGAHPIIYLAAAAKVGMGVDEFGIAGAVLGQPIRLVHCKTIDVEVPAEAEIVLEGELLAGVHEPEGPFGEYTGYSTDRSTNNVFVLRAVTRRARPVYLDIIPGYSAEHLILGRAAKEAHVYERLKEVIPSVRELYYPRSGTHFHAYLSLDHPAEGQARQALLLLFGLDAYVKLAVAVDTDIDVADEEQVLWAMATRMQADRDTFVVPRVFCNRLDPSSIDGQSAKLGIDATVPAGWKFERTHVPPEAVETAQRLLSN